MEEVKESTVSNQVMDPTVSDQVMALTVSDQARVSVPTVSDQVMAPTVSDQATVSVPTVTNQMMTPTVSDQVMAIEVSDQMLAPTVLDQVMAPIVSDQVMAPEVSDQAMTPTLSDQVMAPKVLDQAMAPEVVDQVMAPEISDQAMAPTVSDQVMAPEVSDLAKAPTLSDQVMAPTVSDQVMAPEVSDLAKAPTLSDQVMAPEVSDQVMAPTVSDQVMAPQLSDQVMAPQLSDQVMAPEVSDQVMAPKVSDQVMAPKVSDQVMAPEVSDQAMAPTVSDQVMAPEVSDQAMAPEVSDQVLAPEVSDQMMVPEVSDQVMAPEVSDQVMAPEVSDQVMAPEVMDQVLAPRVSDQVMAPIVSDQAMAFTVSDQAMASTVRCIAVVHPSSGIHQSNFYSLPVSSENGGENSTGFEPVQDSDRESLFSEMEDDNDSVMDPDFEMSDVGTEDSSESSLSKEDSCTNTEVMDVGNSYISDSDASDEIPVQPTLTKFLKGHRGEGDTISFGLLPKGQRKENCKQIYDKINYCTFCCKEIKSKISRHILSVHKREQRVSDIINMPKRSESRLVALEILANEGNFKHNIEVLKKKKGHLVVGRRETKTRNVKPGDYLPCRFCKKFIMKQTLWLHHRNCTVNRFYMKEKQKGNETNQTGNNAIRQSRHLLNSALLEHSDRLVTKMLVRMHDDEVTDVVRSDMLIRKYAALRVESLGEDKDQKINDMHRVSQCCRTLARLVICCKEKNTSSIINLDKLISPEHFDLVVSATMSMSIDKENVTASVGRFIGNILAHVIQTKKGDALRSSDVRRLEKAEQFQRLYDSEWNYRVNNVCQKRINNLNRQKVKTVPLTSDLQKLRHHIVSSMKSVSNSLKESKLPDDWTSLAKLTICRLILFNKRRRAEVKDLKLADYLKRPNWRVEQQGEFEMALSTSDKLLAERMDMVVCAGKSRKNVDAYVLLPPDAKGAINLLNSLREEVGIPTHNPYIFARMNSNAPLSGNTDLREIVDSCPDLQNPDRISSTSLRKYIATVSQILDMTDKELEMLANHLGHDPKTHKENYRLSHSTRELTVVSQLLIAVDNGCVNKWRGQQLANISVDELPDIEQLCEEEQSDFAAANDEEDADCIDPYVPACSAIADAVSDQAAHAVGASHQEAGANNVDENHIKRTFGNKRKPWSSLEEDYLRICFKYYLNGTKCSVNKNELVAAQKSQLGSRTLAQIRSKLNNIKLGKSK